MRAHVPRVAVLLAATPTFSPGIPGPGTVAPGFDWMTYYVNTDTHPFTRQYVMATPWDDPKIYAIFKGFGHGLTKPKAHRAAMQQNLDWFTKYLWNQPPGTHP